MPRLFLPLVLLVGGCSEYEFTQRSVVDSFQQVRMNAVDLLIVVDNSCSMVEEQDNLAQNFEALIATFTEAEVSWRIGVTTTDVEDDRFRGVLLGGDDEIILRGPTGEVDRVEYTRTWGFARGIALQLDGNAYGLSKNDSASNWCAATSSYGTDHYGTPGSWNVSCDGNSVTEPSAGTDDGPVAPRSGHLLVTEIMAESAGQDSLCEWVELTNATDDTLDLSGVVIKDLGRNSVTLPDGMTVGPYEAIVVGRSEDAACGAPVDVAFDEGFTLNDDSRWIDADTVDGDEIFAEKVALGTSGTGIEMGFEAARQVFEPPYIDENAGFLRDEAGLALLMVSDEEDASPYPVDAYLRYLTDLKGVEAWRTPGTVRVSGVIGKDEPQGSVVYSCESENGVAYYGERYIDAANKTGGLIESICAEDFAPIIERLGLTLSGLEANFELSEWPVLDTLEVKLYSTPDEAGFERDLVRDVDFTYVGDGNYLHFEEEQVPPSEWYVVAEYVVQASTNEAGSGGEEE